MFSRFALIVSLLIPICSNAASLCEQTFTVMAKSPGSPSILAYQEELTGGCENHLLNLVFLHEDVITSTQLGIGGPPAFILDYFGILGEEESVKLTDSNGVYTINDTIRFRAPEFDSTFGDRWHAFVNAGGRDEHGWCLQNRDDCADFLTFSGADPVLVHKAGRALYKNYSIGEVTYFPASGTIVVITHQPRKKVGLDTMHGLLVYQIK